MRKFLSLAILAIAFPTLGQPPAPKVDLPTKTVGEYTKQLSDLQTWGKNLTNDKFYAGHFKFKDKKTDKDMKFSDFSPFDKRMFQMTTTQRFNKHLDKLEETWQDDLKKVTGKVPDSKSKADAVAGADDLGKLITGLVKLRKEAVQSWENQANAVFKDYPKEFEDRDKAVYLKNIKALKDTLEGR